MNGFAGSNSGSAKIHEGTWRRLDRGRGQKFGVRVKGTFPRPGLVIRVSVRSQSGKEALHDVRLLRVHRHHAMGMVEEEY